MKEEISPALDKPVVFFDGVCNLCEASVLFILERDKKNRFLFSQLQSDLAKSTLSSENQSLKSFVLLENGKVFTKSTAALRVARHLKGIIKLIWVFIIIPKPIRDVIYDFIARNRYRWFGKKNECMIPTPELKAKFI